MNSTSVFEQKTGEYKSAVENALRAHMECADIPERLAEAMSYSLLAGGKRLRACLFFGIWEMLGGDFNNPAELNAVMPLACALEMIHSYSLIHDDLPCMDNDDFRRGKPTNHKVYGEALAVLSGDGLLSYAFEIMLQATLQYSVSIPSYAAAVCAIAHGAGCAGMVGGQVLDMFHSGPECASLSELQTIHRLKTGALIKAAALAGAYASQRVPGNTAENTDSIESISRFADEYGLLFQITDDVLDVCGNARILGKSTQKDENQGKLTYPLLLGLNQSVKEAEQAKQNAQAILECFGEASNYLKTLVEITCHRDR